MVCAFEKRVTNVMRASDRRQLGRVSRARRSVSLQCNKTRNVFPNFHPTHKIPLTPQNMTYFTATNFVFSALLLYSIYHILSSRRRNGQVLPPGPRRLPFVGNALQMPQKNLWLQLAEWKKKYGTSPHRTFLPPLLPLINTHVL